MHDTVKPPYQFPSPYDFRELLWREPGLVTLTGILLGATVLTAISEIVVRRNSLNKAQMTQTRSPFDSAWPETTLTVTAVAFLLSLGVSSMMMFLDIALVMVGRNASVFPEGARPIVTWLAENHNLRWALPGSLVTFAAIAALHAYRRAQWSGGIGATPQVLDSAMKVAFACMGLSLLLLVLGFAASILGAK